MLHATGGPVPATGAAEPRRVAYSSAMLRPRCLLAAVLIATGGHAATAPETIATNAVWDRLPAPTAHGGRRTLASAARALGGATLRFAAVEIDADRLAALGDTAPGEPLVRAVRERLGRPVDLGDFLLFLDDLATARVDRGTAWVPSGRARAAGILLHPDDVFAGTPRRYGDGRLALTRPPEPRELEPAADGDPPGPRWTARYRNPADEEAMLAALERASPGDLADRVRALLEQFRHQGAEAHLLSTVRRRERGYLMYGAFILSRASGPAQVERRARKLERLKRQWGLDVAIRWRHPDGWRATVAAAEAMAEAYDVVYATERGARYSSHYDGSAVDLAVLDLPRRVTLAAPDGARRGFDLSAPHEPRDLNLTPRMIAWVEEHFGLRKLRSDYAHWTDAATD